ARLEVTWPKDAKAGSTGVLRVQVRHGFVRTLPMDVRIPLPPGATLAEPVTNVRQVQGALMIRQVVANTMLPTLVEIPVRFALAGNVTVPEASARVVYEELPRAIAP